MGLDVYVGSLTRYYSGDWELIAQKVAREIGANIDIVRQYNPPDAIRDPGQIRPMVLAWRQRLSLLLTQDLPEPLDWDESPEAAYFTDKPTWDCYGDLLIWAAHAEQPQFPVPCTHLDDWTESSAYRACNAPGFKQKYSHLFGVEMWLPIRFTHEFETESIAGKNIWIGSSATLADQLHNLNKQTWNADKARLADWLHAGSEHGAPLENGARFAFALLLNLAEKSVRHKLPMLLDW